MPGKHKGNKYKRIVINLNPMLKEKETFRDIYGINQTKG